MWEHDLIKLYKGLFHVNPGGFTYTEGWSELMRDYTEIMEENTLLREKAGRKSASADVDASAQVQQSAMSDGWLRTILGVSMIAGGIVLVRRRRKK